MRVAVLCLAMSGCAWWSSHRDEVRDALVLVQDAAQVLQVLEALSTAHFAEHPNAKAEADISLAFARAHMALDAMHRAECAIDAAEAFEREHTALLAMMGHLGIRQSISRDGQDYGVPRPMVK